MNKVKRLIMICVCLCFSLLSAGCLEEVGTGIAIGALGSQTFLGAQEDLATLELSLQDQLAQAVANGDADRITRLEKAIASTQLAMKGVDAGQKFIGIDWSDPNAVGTAGGGLVALLLTLFYGKKQHQKYKAHERGTENFMRVNDAVTSNNLYASIGEERKKAKL